MKKYLSVIIGIIIATCAHAADPATRDIATSQYYVEEQLANRQDIVPAKTGTKVVTPTGTKGAIGERDIKTTLGNETTNQNDTGLTTVETVNTALDNKQLTLYNQPTVNVMTYTGTNTDSNSTNNRYGAGVVTTTPIYDTTTNTYGNGLVRAGTLNTAVATAVSGALTQVDENGTESNNGTLWRINDLNNILPTTIYAVASDTPTSYCYKRVQTDADHPDANNSCSAALTGTFVRGDWGVVMAKQTGITYSGTCTGNSCGKEVRGISACIGTSGTFAVMAPANLTSILQTAYTNGQSGATPTGPYCYCKATEPHIGTTTVASPWVFLYPFGSASACALSCAINCAYYVWYNARFRGGVFGGVAQ